MAMASNVSVEINMAKVPLIGKTYNLVDDGCIPGASFRNLEFAEDELFSDPRLDYNLKMIAFDAQTSGGLLMSVPSDKVDLILKELHMTGLLSAAIIGSVTGKKEKYLNLGA